MYTYNVLNRFANLIGVSFIYGDEDIWRYFHRSPKLEVQWLYIRDHKLNLIYYGYISAWSESESESLRELILCDVNVYENFKNENGSAIELYSVEYLYLSRNFDDLSIELPNAS